MVNKNGWVFNEEEETLTIFDEQVLTNGFLPKKVIIKEGVKSIPDRAFSNYGSLMEITIPDSVTSIGSFAFFGCHNLKKITIPNTVTTIGYRAFDHCESLTEITIPEGVTYIGNNAFFDCDKLTSIQVDPNNTTYTSVDGILFNKDKTELIRYPSAKSSSRYEIPEGVTDIGKDAFYHCCNLTEITIPDTVTTIGDRAFSSCKSLTEITIPDSVTSIGKYIFTGCDKLMNDDKSVYFSDYNKNNGNE